jgi:hypothetical protein
MSLSTHRPSTVRSLLLRRCPAAVLRRVRAIVIDPVEGRSLRPVPHVLDECFEALAPSLADCDPTAAVVRIVLVLRSCASALHARPGLVEHVSGLVSSVAMNERRLSETGSCDFAMKAAARARRSASETGCADRDGCTAFAAARPVRDALAPRGETVRLRIDDGQASESLAYEIGPDGTPMEAAARSRSSVSERRSEDSLDGSALTFARPVGPSRANALRGACASEHRKASECFPGQICEFGHSSSRGILVLGAVA